MKRLALLLGLTIVGVSSLWAAKSKPITPSLNIKGTVIRNYGEIQSGTQALLLCAVKHKMTKPEDEPYMAALLIGNDWQLIPLDDWRKYFRPDSAAKGDFWKLEQLPMAEYYEKKGMREKLRWEQKQEADEVALRYMACIGRHPDALASALHKLNDHYQREKDMEALDKYGAYGTLPERVSTMKVASPLPQDRIFLKRMRSIVSFEAAMQDYNKLYKNSRRMAKKNIDNGLAAPDDYLLVARSLMKQSNTPESNEECWLYLEKADLVAEVEDVNVTKMKILLKLRTNEQTEAVALLKRYQTLLDALYQQPHTEEDAEWITAEHAWAEKLLERLYLL